MEFRYCCFYCEFFFGGFQRVYLGFSYFFSTKDLPPEKQAGHGGNFLGFQDFLVRGPNRLVRMILMT